MRKEIEEVINNPNNNCILGYSINSKDNICKYFINVSYNHHLYNADKIFIEKEEIKEIDNLIKQMNTKMAKRKMAKKKVDKRKRINREKLNALNNKRKRKRKYKGD